MNHIAIFITHTTPDLDDILIAELSEIGFDGFEEVEEGLNAFIKEAAFSDATLYTIIEKYQVTFSKSVVPQQNWNELWENNFSPMQVADFVGVRANFHQPIKNVQHEIIITPKMSFGTGHHATTYMMMQLMQDIDFTNKTVFDFGSGTGILAILAEKLGSHQILAIDYDDWCIENATENVDTNNCTNIIIQKSDTAKLNKQYDIVIANINKNIILDNLQFLAEDVALNGQILLSGLLVKDEADILAATEKLAWVHQKTIVKGMWIALHFAP
jgi:ribosomal protein L11 methyltransferase